MIASIRILYLEDSSRDAELVHDRLELEGIESEFVVVGSRAAFEDAVKQGPWHVILCDYNLPGYDGMTALRYARIQVPNAPIIVISSGLPDEVAVECLHLGACDYLLKQNLARLPSAVNRALEQVAEREMAHQAEKMFRSLLEFAPDAMLIVDSDGEVLLLNGQAEALLGYDRSELLGRSIEMLIPERFRTGHQKLVASYFSAPENRTLGANLELIGLRKDGTEFPFESSLSPLDSMHGTLTICSIRDMTERRRLESQLVKAQRMESIGAFAGNIAHDLNNALSPIMMGLELLRMDQPHNSELIDTMSASLKRGSDMLRQLLIFSKGSHVVPKPVSVIDLVEEIEIYARRTFPSVITLNVQVADGLLSTTGDTTQLHQVLLNLCVNAKDAMPNGGCLRIEASNMDMDDSYAANIPGAVPGKYVMLRVTDSGHGMAEDVLNRIFEPFFTTKEHGKGTGLGLSIVVGIVKSHRGFISAYSAVGKGTTFTIYLPADVPADHHRLSALEAPKLDGKGRLVLVVDDSEPIRKVASAALRTMQFEPVVARNGVDGLQMVMKHRSELAVLITDYHMPLGDGLTLVSSIREFQPDLPIIVISGYLDDRIIGDLKQLKVEKIIEKPFCQETLAQALRSVLPEDQLAHTSSL